MILESLLYTLIFPGFLFTAVLGLIVGWLDRKISARFQYRVGPPFLQNFNDIFKLFGKETILIKDTLTTLFILAPMISFSILILISTILGLNLFFAYNLSADLIVIIYLLMIPTVMLVIGGSSTGNIFSSIGSGREIKLLLADELTFILVCLIPIIKSGYQLNLNGIISSQQGTIFAGSISGIIAFVIALLCIQAKMTLPPFHIPEAETEIVEGPLIEYSGSLLAFWKLNHFMMYVVYPFLLIALFLGGFNFEGIGIFWSSLKYFVVVLLMIIIKNTNPRITIDKALKFFWMYATPLTGVALLLAIFGY